LENPKEGGVIRTDDAVNQIEYVTGAKWTLDQRKKVMSVLRMYRHQSILEILDRAAGTAEDSEGGKGVKSVQ
jgi:hypothetical protein